jgi:hypothetical protein
MFLTLPGSESPHLLELQKRMELYTSPGWDDEDALAVPQATIERITDFLEQLGDVASSAQISAGLDGSLGIVWASHNSLVYLDILADGRARIFIQEHGLTIREDVLQFNQQNEHEIAHDVRRVVAPSSVRIQLNTYAITAMFQQIDAASVAPGELQTFLAVPAASSELQTVPAA